MSDNAVAAEAETTRPRTCRETGRAQKSNKTDACSLFHGYLTGALSFYLPAHRTATGLQANNIIGLLLLAAGVVFQKHVFMLLKLLPGVDRQGLVLGFQDVRSGS